MIKEKEEDRRLLKQLYSRLQQNHPASRIYTNSTPQNNPILHQVSHEMIGKSIFTKSLRGSKKYRPPRSGVEAKGKMTNVQTSSINNGKGVSFDSSPLKRHLARQERDVVENQGTCDENRVNSEFGEGRRRVKTWSSQAIQEGKEHFTPLLIIRSHKKDNFVSDQNCIGQLKKPVSTIETNLQKNAKQRVRSAYLTSRRKKMTLYAKGDKASQLRRSQNGAGRGTSQMSNKVGELRGWETSKFMAGSLRTSKRSQINWDEDQYEEFDDLQIYL